MIELSKVIDQISAKRLALDETGIKKGQVTKLKGQISFLTIVAHYLRTFPTDEFVNSELNRLNKRVKLIEADFEKWIPNKQYPENTKGDRKKFSDYQKEMGVPKIKLQTRALRFISND